MILNKYLKACNLFYVIMLFLIFSGLDCWDAKLKIENCTGSVIYYKIRFDTNINDWVYAFVKPYLQKGDGTYYKNKRDSISPNQIRGIAIPYTWENALQNSVNKKVYVYIIAEEKIAELSNKVNISENDIDKIYEFTIEELKKINWHIRYK